MRSDVLIVGGSGGIGAELRRSLTFRGLHPVPTFFTNPVPDGIRVDVRDPDQIAAAVEKVQPGVVVNCAGIQANGRVQSLPVEDWCRVIDVNLTAAFVVTREALPFMFADGYGRIIHLSSMAGRLPLFGASAYAASKAGLEGFVRTAAVEVAKRGVTINCVAPGPVTVGMGDTLPERAEEAFRARIPSGEFGHPLDVATAIAFLINSPYVNGQSIAVDGGMW